MCFRGGGRLSVFENAGWEPRAQGERGGRKPRSNKIISWGGAFGTINQDLQSPFPFRPAVGEIWLSDKLTRNADFFEFLDNNFCLLVGDQLVRVAVDDQRRWIVFGHMV